MIEREVVIVDGCRTPFGRQGGGLKAYSAAELGGLAVKGLLERTKILEKAKVDSLMFGMAIMDHKSLGLARYVSQYAGLPFETSATFVEMQCGSAITALNHMAWKILMGAAEIGIVGGCESYSNLPATFVPNMYPPQFVAHKMLTPNADRDTSMIQNSDKMAANWHVTKEMCDDYGYRSQQRLDAAYKSGLIGPEIVPVITPGTKKTPEIVCDKDEHPRPEVPREKLDQLKPIFEGGVTTAANASGINDGASCLLVMTREKAKELGYEPYAKWIGCAHEGFQEDYMGVAASRSNLTALKACGLEIKDIDCWESNEAFAAQQLSVLQDMKDLTGVTVNQSKWNPNGGAIAIGHPNGASGTRIAWFCMKQLEKTGGKYGSISSCCGGGQGTTAMIENLRR